MCYHQQPPMMKTITNLSRIPHSSIDDPDELYLPSSWSHTPLQNPFDSTDPLHYRHPSTINNTKPKHPFSKLILSTYLNTYPCVFQHYLPHPNIDMSKHTIDWPCGCTRPKTLQLTTTDCLTLFPTICHCVPNTPAHQLCPQCRLGHSAIRPFSCVTPIAYIVEGTKWFKIKARSYGPKDGPPKPSKKRSNCGPRTALTDRKGRRNGRKRLKS